MKPYQIAYLVLLAAEIGYQTAMHGKPRDEHNFWLSLASWAVFTLILGFFGFWKQ